MTWQSFSPNGKHNVRRLGGSERSRQFSFTALVMLLMIGATIIGHSAHAQGQSEICATTPNEAALRFVSLGVSDPVSTTSLIRDTSLQKYRARLGQILDERYSPDSLPFRTQLLGSEWTAQRMHDATDAEIVGRFLSSGDRTRQSWHISDEKIVESKKSSDGSQDVKISYRIEAPIGISIQKRDFVAYFLGGCWKVDIPAVAWARLSRLAEMLKESRKEKLTPRLGPSRVRLEVVPGSLTAQNEMRKLLRRTTREDVWIGFAPILTQDNIRSAEAIWDCEAGLGPEDPAVRIEFDDTGSMALHEWTSKNIGSMLAVVVDEEVAVLARVTTGFGSRLSICFPGNSLEQTQALAKEILGAPR